MAGSRGPAEASAQAAAAQAAAIATSAQAADAYDLEQVAASSAQATAQALSVAEQAAEEADDWAATARDSVNTFLAVMLEMQVAGVVKEDLIKKYQL